jgi:hypothetical protein
MGHLRYGLVSAGGARYEAFVQIQRNAFVRLRRRVLAGGGARLPLLRTAGSDPGGGEAAIDLGLVVMHESEKLASLAGTDAWRASILLSARLGIAENATAGGQVYYQPRLTAWSDARVLADAGVTVRLLGPLSLMVEARVVHDARPPQDVKTTDLSVRNTLAVVF